MVRSAKVRFITIGLAKYKTIGKMWHLTEIGNIRVSRGYGKYSFGPLHPKNCALRHKFMTKIKRTICDRNLVRVFLGTINRLISSSARKLNWTEGSTSAGLTGGSANRGNYGRTPERMGSLRDEWSGRGEPHLHAPLPADYPGTSVQTINYLGQSAQPSLELGRVLSCAGVKWLTRVFAAARRGTGSDADERTSAGARP